MNWGYWRPPGAAVAHPVFGTSHFSIVRHGGTLIHTVSRHGSGGRRKAGASRAREEFSLEDFKGESSMKKITIPAGSKIEANYDANGMLQTITWNGRKYPASSISLGEMGFHFNRRFFHSNVALRPPQPSSANYSLVKLQIPGRTWYSVASQTNLPSFHRYGWSVIRTGTQSQMTIAANQYNAQEEARLSGATVKHRYYEKHFLHGLSGNFKAPTMPSLPSMPTASTYTYEPLTNVVNPLLRYHRFPVQNTFPAWRNKYPGKGLSGGLNWAEWLGIGAGTLAAGALAANVIAPNSALTGAIDGGAKATLGGLEWAGGELIKAPKALFHALFSSGTPTAGNATQVINDAQNLGLLHPSTVDNGNNQAMNQAGQGSLGLTPIYSPSTVQAGMFGGMSSTTLLLMFGGASLIGLFVLMSGKGK